MSIGQQPIITGLYSLLSGDTGAGGVATLTGGRIYDGQAPENATLPLVTVNMITDADVQFFSGPDVECYIQIDSYGKRELGKAAVRAISDRLYALLNDQQITIVGLNDAQGWMPDKGTDMAEQDAYRIRQELRIKGS